MDLSDILQSSSGGAKPSDAQSAPVGAVNGGMEVDDQSQTEAGPSRSRLILPEFDFPPLKPLHASHDFLSLLNLAPLYNTYVRPYADALPDPTSISNGRPGMDAQADLDADADEPGQAANGHPSPRKRGKRKRLERGYWPVFLEDIIDPVPVGEGNKQHRSLLPLIPDLGPMGGVGSGIGQVELWEGEIGIIGERELEVGRLEVGSKVDGYAGGMKHGVKEAEDRRRRRKQRHSLSLTNIHLPADAPLEDGTNSAEANTPLQPVLPPQKPPFHIRNNSLGGGPGGIPPKPTFSGVPRPTSAGPFTPNFPRKRPLDAPSGGGSAKRNKGGPSRSASPLVAAAPSAAPPAQRLGVPKHGARARTEG